MRILVYDASRRKTLTTGYGLVSTQFGERLKGLGNEVVYYDENPDFNADIWLWTRPPHYVEYKQFLQTNKNVFYTMHEEATFTGWKANWPSLLNRCTAIVTPTEWNKEVFEKGGVTKPIYVVPMGVDTKNYIGNRTYEFSLLSVHEAFGKDSSRENWKDSVEAYYATFYDNHNTEVSYTIKSWNSSREGFDAFTKQLVDSNNYDREKLPRVDLIDMELVVQDMNRLYGRSWAYIKNSQRECWSLPTLEAVACGVRIIGYPLPSIPYLNNDNTDFFQNREELKEKLWENFTRWRKWKISVSAWSWQNATKKLNTTLGEIMSLTV